MKNYNHKSRNNKTSQEIGIALVEFVLVIPIFFVLLVGVFEYTRALRTKQAVSVLVREAGNIAFRKCAAKARADSVQACLDGVIGDITRLAENSSVGEIDLIISVYYRPLGTDDSNTIRKAIFPVSGFSAPNGHTTRFTVARLKQPPLEDVIAQNELVTVAEVFHFHPALFTTFLQYFDFTNFVVYEAAIF